MRLRLTNWSLVAFIGIASLGFSGRNAALVMASDGPPPADATAKPEFQRLPPVGDEPAATLAEPVTDAPEATEIVIHAGGAVELSLPAGWQVRELPAGREIQLILSPPGALIEANRIASRMTVVYLAHPGADQRGHDELAQWLIQRLDRRNRRFGEPQFERFGPWSSVRVGLESPNEEDPEPAQIGFRLAIATPWGICEIEAVEPADSQAPCAADFDRILQSLKLHQPRIDRSLTNEAVREAEPILGSWKAYRSRLRLLGSGRVTLVLDDAGREPLGGEASPSPATRVILDGVYEARGDILFIVWNDGSQQNYRWRREANALLLTDHTGQTSRLRRIYD